MASSNRDSSSSKTARSMAARGNALPASIRREVAFSANFAGKASVLALIPMPKTTYSTRSISAAISVRMPQTLRLPMTTSFGHLSLAAHPVTERMPRQTAMPAKRVMLLISDGTRLGRSKTLNQIPVPAGDSHVRPKRPLPPVCRSARNTLPSGAPHCACRLASSLVESTSCSATMFLPIARVCNPQRISSGVRTSGDAVRRYPRFVVESMA